MRGYVAQRRNRFYAVIYEGIDPITGRERRRWHPAGTDREQAEELATALAAPKVNASTEDESVQPSASTSRSKWLPAKQLTLRPSTWDGYRRLIELHVLPHLGRVPLRHLRAEHLDRLYATLLERGRCNGGGGLDIKTVHEVHIVIRRALRDAERRGSIVRNPAELAHAPKASASHLQRVSSLECRSTGPNFSPWPEAVPTSPPCGWPPIPACAVAKSSDCAGATWISSRPGCRSIARLSRSPMNCTNHEARRERRGARSTSTSARSGTRDHPLLQVSDGEAYVFCHNDGSPIHPQVLSDAFKRLVCQSGLPRIRLHDLRHTHATLLLKAGVLIKVVSERLGHSTPGFTMATYQHVLPGMQAEAAKTFAALLERPANSVR